jgi:hypothetical protein
MAATPSTTSKTATQQAANPVGGTWNLSRWKQAPATGVTIFQALNITRGTVKYPSFQAQLPSEVAAAQATQTTSQGGGGGTGTKTKGGKTPTGGGKGGSPSANAALGRAMAASVGWTGAQWVALNNIVMHESGWSTTAQNPTSPAYGIPQADPGSKMASAGADWRTNPRTQIKWMIGYIRSRYGNPVNAWRYWQAHSSY